VKNTENGYKCCFTGYRPEKFPFPIDSDSKEAVCFDNLIFNSILDLVNSGVSVFYCGMAMGFDLIAAETVLDIKSARPDLNLMLIAAVPFIDQASAFTDSWKERYKKVLSAADQTVLISDKYFKGCYMTRNKFMVDRSDFVLTYFDGKNGGTKNTVDYAISKNRTIINLAEKVQK